MALARGKVLSQCTSSSGLLALAKNSEGEYGKKWRARWPGVSPAMVYHDEVEMHLLPSEGIDELFGRGPDRCHTLLVDVHDDAKLRRLRALYVEGSGPGYCMKRVVDLLDYVLHPAKGYVKWCNRDLRDRWLTAQREHPSDAFLVPSPDVLADEPERHYGSALRGSSRRFDHAHPWCREIIENIPDLQLVICFRLCISECHERRILSGGNAVKYAVPPFPDPVLSDPLSH